MAVWFGLQNWNKLALGDVTNQNFQVRGLILGTFSLDMAVWFGLQNLNKLAFGDMTRQNFPVSCLILGIFLALYVLAEVLILGIFLHGLAVWLGLQNLTKFALGDMTRQNFPARVLTLGTFFDLVWRFGLVCKT
jgi:hypothetical protein